MILITGGAGYIGSCFAWACEDGGLPYVVMDNLSSGNAAALPRGCDLEVADVADRRAVRAICEKYGVEAAVHFAGSVIVEESMLHPDLYYQNNTAATLSLLSELTQLGIRKIVFSSTAAVYGSVSGEGGVEESAVPFPVSPYGRSKLYSEQMLEDFSRAYDLRYVALRYFNVAGCDPMLRTGLRAANATHLMKVCSEVAVGRRSEVVIYGDDYDTPDGTGVRDYIHVADLVDAHLKSLAYLSRGGRSAVMNCGYGRGVSVLEAIDAFSRVLGRPLPHRIASRRRGDTAAVVAENGRIRATLGWSGIYQDVDFIAKSMLDWERRLLEEGRP